MTSSRNVDHLCQPATTMRQHLISTILMVFSVFYSGDIDGEGTIDLIGESHCIGWVGPRHKGTEYVWTPPGACA